jgi:hypothetical protein
VIPELARPAVALATALAVGLAVALAVTGCGGSAAPISTVNQVAAKDARRSRPLAGMPVGFEPAGSDAFRDNSPT